MGYIVNNKSPPHAAHLLSVKGIPGENLKKCFFNRAHIGRGKQRDAGPGKTVCASETRGVGVKSVVRPYT